MKSFYTFIMLFLSAFSTNAQILTVDNLFMLVSFSPSKCENQLMRNGFSLKDKEIVNDTLVRIYTCEGARKAKVADSVCRSISRNDIKDETYICYEISSQPEFRDLISQLKTAGFYCNDKNVEDPLCNAMYQNNELWVRTCIKRQDSTCRYSLLCHKKIFPRLKDIFYANDLLTFTSHEYLVHYFGEKNVRKDTCFLSENEFAKCSVLFLNTNRQVVFIWEDEDNLCNISRILLGGQQNLKSSMKSGKYVQENNWALKSGLRPGMSLLELRMLNGKDFNFYGGNSVNPGTVIPDQHGKLDFKNEEIVLGCLNCRDDKYSAIKVINTDDSIDDGRLLFVLSIILHPL